MDNDVFYGKIFDLVEDVTKLKTENKRLNERIDNTNQVIDQLVRSLQQQRETK